MIDKKQHQLIVDVSLFFGLIKDIGDGFVCEKKKKFKCVTMIIEKERVSEREREREREVYCQ